MGSGFNFSNIDHTIFDQQGIRAIDKEGKEHQITKEDWKKAHPEHRNTECKECTFVLDAETILAFHVPKEVRDKATSKPKFIGKFTMPGWSGHSGFYIFKCPDCDEIRVDYPHGYCEEGCLYVRCDGCMFRIVFYPSKDGDVYKREGVVPPPTFFEKIKNIWTLRNIKRIKT